LSQEGYYQLPVKLLKKGWQEVKYVALYVKNGVADVHGISIYGKSSNIAFVQDRQNNELAKFEVDLFFASKKCRELQRKI